MSVLAVDDQPHILRVIKLGLERQGHSVATAKHGQEAFEKLGTESFDVVVSDMDMPVMNGQELFQKIREELDLPDVPVFLVTAKTDPQLRQWAEKQVRLSFLEKPLSLRVLGEKLEEQFSDDDGDSEGGLVVRTA